ncbi:aminofutalosine synthase MqnE [Helicobacter cholecystus]|uniref:Aminodeoxyfutalosine synthase n=1 Tax=Helicobacter cholecystus TaxID=45498 RepID=A0A3D8IYD8_9HELI|nr:aminofutalosine synthase MqnE [Helicobacter cholecystus]RDU70006.1 aminofutalosine synthase MqnE [Helicobacter cholecystus]VEJ24824.1 SCO4494 family menaquinone biosynthesis protein [Helicobacter cholecystus]
MEILERVLEGEALPVNELTKLYDYDLYTLGEAADKIRREKFSNQVFFNINRHINPSNICADVCKFCAFSASRKNPNSYEMNLDEILTIAQNAVHKGAKEVHIVSSHSPNYTYEWYMGMFKEIKSAFPALHIKAMTAAEVDYFSRRFAKSYEQVLEDMANAGVDSMPGGGAEIFDEGVRKIICQGKVKSNEWLHIHSLWHKMGRYSNATMLFGHIEERKHRIDHILRLKAMQNTQNHGGYNAFIPLLYQKENNFLNVKSFPTSQEILKTLSIARILLDNISHIKAYWATLGLNLALVAQEFGADDIDGTIEVESIQSRAGAKSAHGVELEDLVYKIKDAGFIPVERDSLYHIIKTY